MNIDEMIDVLQAHRDGVEIEGKCLDSIHWGLAKYPSWNFSEYSYRIKPQLKKIDMSVCIESEIDCEFPYKDGYIRPHIGKLRAITLEDSGPAGTFPYKSNLTKNYDSAGHDECRVRQDHWVYNEWDKCPIPEGLNVEFLTNTNGYENTERYTKNTFAWHVMKAFKVTGVAEGYEY